MTSKAAPPEDHVPGSGASALCAVLRLEHPKLTLDDLHHFAGLAETYGFTLQWRHGKLELVTPL